MDELTTLLAQWEQENYINPDGLKSAHSAMTLLVSKIEELEQRIQALEASQ